MLLQKILAFDKKTSERLRIPKSQRLLWILSAFFAHSGDSWWWLIGLFILWSVGKIWSVFDSSVIETCAFLGLGIVGLIIIIFAIKLLVRRRRPKGEWGKIYRDTDPHSFPSGHAARCFFLAVMAFTSGSIWFGILAAVWAMLVCVARVVMGVHYFSDVFVGIMIGSLWGVIMLLLKPVLISGIPFIFA